MPVLGIEFLAAHLIIGELFKIIIECRRDRRYWLHEAVSLLMWVISCLWKCSYKWPRNKCNSCLSCKLRRTIRLQCIKKFEYSLRNLIYSRIRTAQLLHLITALIKNSQRFHILFYKPVLIVDCIYRNLLDSIYQCTAFFLSKAILQHLKAVLLRHKIIAAVGYLKLYLVMCRQILFQPLLVEIDKPHRKTFWNRCRYKWIKRIIKVNIRLITYLIHKILVELSVAQLINSTVPCIMCDNLTIKWIIKCLWISSYYLRRIPECHIRELHGTSRYYINLTFILLSYFLLKQEKCMVILNICLMVTCRKRSYLKKYYLIITVNSKLDVKRYTFYNILYFPDCLYKALPVRRKLLRHYILGYPEHLTATSACYAVCWTPVIIIHKIVWSVSLKIPCKYYTAKTHICCLPLYKYLLTEYRFHIFLIWRDYLFYRILNLLKTCWINIQNTLVMSCIRILKGIFLRRWTSNYNPAALKTFPDFLTYTLFIPPEILNFKNIHLLYSCFFYEILHRIKGVGLRRNDITCNFFHICLISWYYLSTSS